MMVPLFFVKVLCFVFCGFGTETVVGSELFMAVKDTSENRTASWIEYGNNLCPYKKRCKIALDNNNIVPEYERDANSQCQPCECSAKCWTTNCCQGKSEVKSVCRDQSTLFNAPRNLRNVSSSQFYIIDRCTESYSDSGIIDDCLYPKKLLDLVLVSDKTFRIFKNEKCAKCNYVNDFVHWDLVAMVNVSVLDYDINTLTETLPSVLPVYSRPPASLSMSRLATFRCYPDAISVCNVTLEWDRYDAGLENLCLTSSTTTYIGYYYGLPELYSNVYCYLCNKESGSVNQPVDTAFFQTRSSLEIETETDVKIIFDTSKLRGLLAGSNGKDRCNVDEVYDSFMEKCHKLLCPIGSVAVNGRCDTSLYHVEGIVTSIVFEIKASKLIDVESGRRLYFKNILDNLIKGFEIDIFSNMCIICRTMYYQNDQSLKMFLELAIHVKGECKEFLITETVSKIAQMKTVSINFEYLFQSITLEAKLATDFKRTETPMIFSKRQSANWCEDKRRNNNQDSLVLSPSIRLTETDIEIITSSIGALASETLLQSIKNDSSSFTLNLDEYMSIFQERSTGSTISTDVCVLLRIRQVFVISLLLNYIFCLLS